jgi:hypothetical protein
MDIVTFCASHISNANRLKFLGNTIESILAQNYKVCFYLSISWEIEGVRESLEKYANNTYVKIFYHANQKLSQFEHYDYLYQQIDPFFRNRTWVMFTDDDDFSPPLRAKWYSIYIKTFSTQKANSIVSPYLLTYFDPAMPNLNNCLEALDKGKARVISSVEYVLYCVRLQVLGKFLGIMKKHRMLKTPLCDTVFSSVLHHITQKNHRTELARWMYAYNQHTCDSRLSQKYNVEYYKATYKKELFRDLANEFKIETWENGPGYTPLWNKNKFKPLYLRLMPIFLFKSVWNNWIMKYLIHLGKTTQGLIRPF